MISVVELRSKSGLTLEGLRKTYDLPIGPQEDFKKDFDERFIKHWTNMFYKYKDEITGEKYKDETTGEYQYIEIPEQYITALHQRAVDLLKDADAWMCCEKEAFIKMVKSGRIKVQAETRSSGGVMVIGARTRSEKQYLGYPEDTHPTMRPVYLYLTDHPYGEMGDVNKYGSWAILFKKTIKKRMTASMCNSLENNNVNCAPCSDPDASIFPLEDCNPLRRYKSIIDVGKHDDDSIGEKYAEGQVHGGLGIFDKKALYCIDPNDLPDEELTEKLVNLGIEVWVRSQSAGENEALYVRKT